jgi:nucleotide-binding universal stress UspA family protein
MQPFYTPIPYVTANNVLRDAKYESLKFSNGKVENLTNRNGGDGIVVITDIFRGFPHIEILKYVDRNEIDLIVMTAIGCQVIIHRLFGRVTQKVLHRSCIPICLHKP